MFEHVGVWSCLPMIVVQVLVCCSQSLPHDAYRGKAQKMPLDIELDDLEADK